MHRRLTKWLVAFWILGVAGSASAQPFPSRPIRFVNQFAVGAAVDQVSRTIGDALSARTGQPVVVENKPGAGGVIAASYVAKSSPDGHIVLIGSTSEVVLAPLLRDALPYDPRRDFRPVAMVATLPLVFLANPQFPINTLPELIAAAKKEPGKFQLGTYDYGIIGHLAQELFKSMAGVDMLTVPYKTARDAYPDVLSGRVPLFLDSVGGSRSLVRAGKLKAIAVSTRTRIADMPDIPTVAEAGLPGFDMEGIIGVFVPAATPDAVVARLSDELLQVLATPAIRERLSAAGVFPQAGDAEALRKYVNATIERFSGIVTALDYRQHRPDRR